MGTNLLPYADEPEVLSQNGELIPSGSRAIQMRTEYATAMSVQKPRNLGVVAQRLMDEADLAGERFYYGWGAGKDRVEGPSIKLALAAARCYGNMAVELGAVQELSDCWIFTASVVDLETGFTLSRQFRQSKKWTVHGKFDNERKDDIRFQIGQSKAIRNVVLNSMPVGLIDKAIAQAKKGVRNSIEQYIAGNGKVKAIDVLVSELKKHGVDPQDICNRFGVSDTKALDVDQLVIMRGDVAAIFDGAEMAETLYPKMPKASASLSDLAGKAAIPEAAGQAVNVVPEATAEESSGVRTDQESRTVDAPGTNPERTALYTEVFPTLATKTEVQELAEKAKADDKLFPADRTVVDKAAQKRLLEISKGRGSRSNGGE